MFLLRRPSRQRIQHMLATQRVLPFSYCEVGASRGQVPAGYNLDHNRVKLGEGPETFARAVAAVQQWTMFRTGWVQLCWPDTPIVVDSTVAVLVNLFGIWSLNACRIVYLIEQDGPTQRYGFAYGTLPSHVERGEERFMVEWRHDDNSVWYDLLAFSRPQHVLAIAAYPLARLLQKRFARDSKRAMVRAVQDKARRSYDETYSAPTPSAPHADAAPDGARNDTSG